jgi:ketosteroid isomerase-like protein
MSSKLIAALVLAATVFPIAGTAADTHGGAQAAVLATVDAALDAAQSGDIKTMRTEYLSDCSFVDEFAPYHWSGQDSMSAYFASAAEMYKRTGMSGTKVSRGSPKYVYVTSTSAYVVVPLEVQATVKGKSYRASGTLVFALQDTKTGWRISMQTWAKASENIGP